MASATSLYSIPHCTSFHKGKKNINMYPCTSLMLMPPPISQIFNDYFDVQNLYMATTFETMFHLTMLIKD